MKIRIDKLDVLFSRFIRLRDKVCQRCGGSGKLQCSHFHGRAKKSVRWDEDNAVALCMVCHMYFTAIPHEHTIWFENHLGVAKFEWLGCRSRTTFPKPDKEAIELYLKEKIKLLEEGK